MTPEMLYALRDQAGVPRGASRTRRAKSRPVASSSSSVSSQDSSMMMLVTRTDDGDVVVLAPGDQRVMSSGSIRFPSSS